MDIDRNIYLPSYAGKPKDNTTLFITKKVEHLIVNLFDVKNCRVFIDDKINIPSKLFNQHQFVVTSNPQYEYAKFVVEVSNIIESRNQKRTVTRHKNGYYYGENVKIGAGSFIEPNVLIGHDVTIGVNSRILAGAVIKNSIIGDNFRAYENCVIGGYGFTMSSDFEGNSFRIPTLGRVIIGSNVEVGMLANVSRGSANDTLIDDFVKLDAFVHIGHDAHLSKNVKIPAGAIIGGFDMIEENVFIGINSTIRNRVRIGENSIIGMGSVVTNDIPKNTVYVGNPAKKLKNI